MTEAMTAARGVKLQPMVHVEHMGEALAFYRALGAEVLFGSRDGDWALVAFDGARMGLLARPPGDGRKETVELQFTTGSPLEEVEEAMRAAEPAFIAQGVTDEAFGRMLRLRSPDGLLVKVVEIERDLVT